MCSPLFSQYITERSSIHSFMYGEFELQFSQQPGTNRIFVDVHFIVVINYD